MFLYKLVLFTGSTSSFFLRIFSWIYLRVIPGYSIFQTTWALFIIYLVSLLLTILIKPFINSKERLNSKIKVNLTEVVSSTDSDTKEAIIQENDCEIDLIEDENENENKNEGIYNNNGSIISFFKSLLFGTASIDNYFLIFISLFINSLLAFAVYDFTYNYFYNNPELNLSYTRIGYVSDIDARIALRVPDYNDLPLYVSLSHETSTDDYYEIKAINNSTLNESTDFTAVVLFDNLTPNTTYVYQTSNGNNGTIRTAPSHIIPEGKFSFLTSSCVKPGFPYNPLTNDQLEMVGLQTNAHLLSKNDFLIFLGNFIYTDIPAMFNTTFEYYSQLYRQVYHSFIKEETQFFTQIPTVHIFDNYEIKTDKNFTKNELYLPEINKAWDYYQGLANPQSYRDNVSYFTFTRQGIPFFVLDCRTYRSPNTAQDNENKTMLGKSQKQDLLNWLEENRSAPFKVIISSIPFSKNWNSLKLGVDDTWGSYLHERELIFAKMWEVGGSIIISGDRHETAAIKYPSPTSLDNNNDNNTVWTAIERSPIFEFSTSPLSDFYIPFSSTNKQTTEEGNDEVTLFYEPNGISKIGQFEFDLTNQTYATMKYSLYIDGDIRWTYELSSRPLPAKSWIGGLLANFLSWY